MITQEYLELAGRYSVRGNDGMTFIDGPSAEGRAIVNNYVWRWEYSEMGGPLFLRKDGTARKCQNPNKKVWKAFDSWLQKYKNAMQLKNCSVKKLRAIHKQMEV
jgi:hypothetical protein